MTSQVVFRTTSRTSHNGIVATVFNGTSFIGMGLLARLGKIGCQIVIGDRGARYQAEKLRIVGDLGQVHYADYDLKDEESLANAMKYSNVVINLVGKQNETRNFPFNEVHVEGPRRMARIARECGVQKFIHFSALNCSPNPVPQYLKNGSQFYRSKYHGELAVREEFPDAVIFRPSDVIGERDNFLNHYTSIERCFERRELSIWDYYYEVQKQPVLLKDVLNGLQAAILDNSSNGKTIQAVGPYRYNFYDLIEFMRASAGQGQKHDDYQIQNLRWNFLIRGWIRVTNLLQKDPILPYERIERDLTSDYVDPKSPTLRDLGVELTPVESEIVRLCYYRPRHHRFEIPYEASPIIDKPERLATVS